MNNSLWPLVKQMDVVSTSVLLILFVMSLICWTVTLYNHFVLRARIRELKRAQELLKSVSSWQDFLSKASTLSDTYAGAMLGVYLTEFKTIAVMYTEKNLPIPQERWDLFKEYLRQTIDDVMHQEELFLPVLSTSAVVSPLLGLFGTVWGLVHAFMGIAQQRSADIAAVAPGIAEALITTLGGLIVAIPALIMFNYVQTRQRMFEFQLASLADRFSAIIKTTRN